MKTCRLISEPVRVNLTRAEQWEDVDQGLIYCWERGREMSQQDPELAVKARSGELVELPFKGAFKPNNDTNNVNHDRGNKGKKFGPLYYLAMWKGLRGEDLSIDSAEEPKLTCAVTGVAVIFTSSVKKYGRG